MTDVRPDILVCQSVADNPTGIGLVPGSVRDRCRRCPQSVWISPSGQIMVGRDRLLIWCTGCATKHPGELGRRRDLDKIQRVEIEMFDMRRRQ